MATDRAAPASDAAPAARVVQVVAAVICREDGRFLLAQRPAGKVYAGYWEFPGGKIETGETGPVALARELHEELGIEVRQAYPWISRRFVYEHATVDLHFYRVTRFEGELHGRENQAFTWQTIGRIDVAPILPANGPILKALALPHVYAITNAAETGVAAALDSLRRSLDAGLRLVQVREPSLQEPALADFALRVIALSHAAGARVLINSSASLARSVGADGLHLKARELLALDIRPDFPLVAASCHDERELARAIALGIDFVVLGPVAPTLSHPGAPAMGFGAFESMIRGCPLPVFALGGMTTADMEMAWRCGAHGIAMQRSAWM